jgi:O-antigen ligase
MSLSLSPLPWFHRAGVFLIGLAFLLPGHYLPWLTFQSQWVGALGVLCVGLGAAQAASRGELANPIAFPPIAWLALLSAFVPMFQWFGGRTYFFSDALLPTLYLIGFALSIAAGATWAAIDNGRWLDGLFAAFSIAAAVSVGLALMQWLGWGSGGVWIADLPRGGRPFANLGQPNHLATLLALGLVGVLRAYEKDRCSAILASIAAAWVVIGLVMVQSRTGWLFVVFLVVWWTAMRRGVGLRIGRLPVLLGAVLLVVGVVIWEPINARLLLANTATLDERLQAGPRREIWMLLADAVWQAPWTGYGWNQVTLAQQAVALDHAAIGRMFQNSHNTVLDLALWAGLPFALLWIVVVGRLLVRQVKACNSADTWCTLAAIGAIVLHAMLEYPLEQAYFLLPLGLLVGALPSHSRPGLVAQWPLSAFFLTLSLMLGALLWIGAEYLKVEQTNRDVRLMLAGFGLDKVPSVPPPDVILLDGPREYHRFMITTASPNMPPDKLDWMRVVAQRNAFAPAMMRYALAAGLNGRATDASLTLQRLCRIHSTERCEEARGTWLSAQYQFPELLRIPLPQ